MRIILRAQKMAAGHVAAALHKLHQVIRLFNAAWGVDQANAKTSCLKSTRPEFSSVLTWLSSLTVQTWGGPFGFSVSLRPFRRTTFLKCPFDKLALLGDMRFAFNDVSINLG
jgi:hypothetical protein